MEITLGHSALLLAASAIVAAAVAYWMYRRTTPQLSLARRSVLTTLRFLSLTIILFLLARPILARLTETRVPPVLAVLVDNSESVGVIGSAQDSSGAQGVRRLAEAVTQEDVAGDIHVYAFDSEARRIDADSIGAVRFDGQRTDISAALESVEDGYADDNLGAIVVLSDGRYNVGRNPIHVADRSRVPIYTVTLGDSTEQRDVRIASLNTNELTYSGLEVPVQVTVSGLGYEGRRATVTLLVNGTPVDTAPVDLPPDRLDRTVELSFVPAEPGLVTVEARITPLEGEITTRNNRASAAMRVLDSLRKVLLVGASPDPDVSALYQTISADDRSDVIRIVQRDGGGFYQGPLPNDLSEFDLLVLVGYPGPRANAADLRRIADAVGQGVPLLFTLTRGTDLQLFRDYLADVVGVRNTTSRRNFFEASVILTPLGKRHTVFEHLGDEDVFTRLPPLAMNESRWVAAPDADVLATMKVRGIDLTDPAIVTRRAPSYRAAAILGAGQWRLTNLPDDLSEFDDYWPTLVNNLVQWLSAARDDRPVRVRPTRDEFAGDEQIEFVGQVYDESLKPIDDAEVEVRITSPSGNEFRHTMKPIGNGRYALEIRPSGEGSYGYSASAKRGDVQLGQDDGSFAVGNLTLEFRSTSADPVIMRQIAHRSGGQQIDAAAVGELPALLAGQPTFVVQSAVARAETELWRQFPFAIGVVLLLTAEWVLRKRSGLS